MICIAQNYKLLRDRGIRGFCVISQLQQNQFILNPYPIEPAFNRTNNLSGWLVFAVSATVYGLTAEPTVSFWDCGEYISTAYKLQVGHPPGAPLFQMLGRIFSLFAFGNLSLIAFAVNLMSAMASAFTVMFLFWTITLLARKVFKPGHQDPTTYQWLVLGSGLAGSLAYMFSDSFWFSAVEGEVYALSSFFTALVFWAILKWERRAGEPGNFRWLVLIAYLIGLSIGVHLLNLLAIPAIVLVFYFRTRKPSLAGFFAALGVAAGLLVLVMYGIIPGMVKIFAHAELLAVNGLGLPFNSGTIGTAAILITFIVSGLVFVHHASKWAKWGLIAAGVLLLLVLFYESHGIGVWLRNTLVAMAILTGMYFLIRNRQLLHTALMAFLFLMIGYGSFMMVVIRSGAGTPINENNPSDAIGLLAYLNREQYGDWPLLYGPHYHSEVIGYRDRPSVYEKCPAQGKYIIKNARKNDEVVYAPDQMMLFPRMYASHSVNHIREYQAWAGIADPDGNHVPGFWDNLRFLWNYQVKHMYLRYFMWNFAGRQNGLQGLSDRAEGNWASGIPFIDNPHIGPQSDLPATRQSKAYNRFYLLPLLTGLAGMFYLFRQNYKTGLVVMALFLMTGLAIVIYLNQYSPQPRERDYAYAASFYAFAIWIGFGMAAMAGWLGRLIGRKPALIVAGAISVIAIPGMMAIEGWDDHDRSGRYTVREMAMAYLDSCEPNAILFTNGDNDTFPLWYVQEVENYRTDVRVCNLSLLGMDWYIDQMKRQVYDSEPLPFTLGREMYRQGTRDLIYLMEEDPDKGDTIDLPAYFAELLNNTDAFRLQTDYGLLDYFPARSFSISVPDSVLRQFGKKPAGTQGRMVFTFPGPAIEKSGLMVLDLLAHYDWQRPVYFGIAVGAQANMGLEKYFRKEGLANRLLPYLADTSRQPEGGLDSGILFENLMNKTQVVMNDPGIYYSEDHIRLAASLRDLYGRLAIALLGEGKPGPAVEVSIRSLQNIPPETVSGYFHLMPFAEVFYDADEWQKGHELAGRIASEASRSLSWYFGLNPQLCARYDYDIRISLTTLNYLHQLAQEAGDDEVAGLAGESFNDFLQQYYALIYHFND